MWVPRLVGRGGIGHRMQPQFGVRMLSIEGAAFARNQAALRCTSGYAAMLSGIPDSIEGVFLRRLHHLANPPATSSAGVERDSNRRLRDAFFEEWLSCFTTDATKKRP